MQLADVAFLKFQVVLQYFFKNIFPGKIGIQAHGIITCRPVIRLEQLPVGFGGAAVGDEYHGKDELKVKKLSEVDLFREFSRISINTVAVYNERKEKIGYLPKEHSEIIARLIDAGKKIYALSIPNDDSVVLKIYMND